MADDFMTGGADEAAAAIQALMDRGPAAPEPEPDEEPQAAPEPSPAPVAAATEEPEDEPNTDEAAPEGDTPADTSQEETEEAPEVTQTPVPAVAAPKAVDTAGNEKLTATTELLTQLNTIVPQLQARLATAFPDVKTFDDLERLAVEDPSRYFQYDILSKRVAEATQMQERASSEYRALWTQQEAVKLGNLLPEWNDPVKGPALKQSLTDFAKEVGYTDAQIAQAGATDILLLREAMEFRNAKKAEQAKAIAHAKALKEAKNKAKDAPPVQKPGTATVTDKGAEKLRALEERYSKTGTVEDLAVLLEARSRAA